MPRTKGSTNWKALATESIEREQQWQARFAETEAALDESRARFDTVSTHVELIERWQTEARDEATLLRRQGDFLRLNYLKLAERYAAAKVDAQLMTLDQANRWHAAEAQSIDQTLTAIEQQHRAQIAARASSDQAGAA